jgi:Flp pilus assembly protein CpaB
VTGKRRRSRKHAPVGAKGRARAVAFAVGALACAGLSAAVAGSANAPAEGFGELRQVIVTRAALERGTVLGPRALRESITERRVPVEFVPPDALGVPDEALKRRLAASLPAGSYLTASALKVPSDGIGDDGGGPPKGTTPVEIMVTGAGALAAVRADPGDRVDVVVSGDSAPGPSSGRTYVAALGVPLLGLAEAQAEPGLEADRMIATLALTRAQALRLIRAESVGAQVRLLAG